MPGEREDGLDLPPREGGRVPPLPGRSGLEGELGDALRSESIDELKKPDKFAQDGFGEKDEPSLPRRRGRLAVVGSGVCSPEPSSKSISTTGSTGR